MKPALTMGLVGFESALNDIHEVSPLPALAGEHVMGSRQGQKPPLEGVLRILRRVGRAQGLGGDRLDGRERVLHPVVQLVNQQLLVFSGTQLLMEQHLQAVFASAKLLQQCSCLILTPPCLGGPSLRC